MSESRFLVSCHLLLTEEEPRARRRVGEMGGSHLSSWVRFIEKTRLGGGVEATNTASFIGTCRQGLCASYCIGSLASVTRMSSAYNCDVMIWNKALDVFEVLCSRIWQMLIL